MNDDKPNVTLSSHIPELKSDAGSKPGIGKRIWSTRGVLVLALVAVCLAIVFVFFRKSVQPGEQKSSSVSEQFALMNEQLEGGDKGRALEHAREALALSPDDIDVILTVVYAAEEAGADDVEGLYAQALKIFRQQNDPDSDGKEPATYLAAGSLAEGAGLKEQAVQYFQKALDTSDFSNLNDQEVITKSQEALGRLR